jgi:hypothetical protein
MSQLNLTPEEDQLILSGLRVKATQYAAMFGSEDQAVLDLITKVEGQLPPPAPVVAVDPPDVVAAEKIIEAHFAAEEAVATPKAKKTKAVEE